MADLVTNKDVCIVGLDIMSAALEPREKADAARAVRALVDELEPDALRAVATVLAVESIRAVRPRRSKRELREWIERQRFLVITQGWEPGDV